MDVGNIGIVGGGLLAVGIFLYSYISGNSGKNAKLDLKKLMGKVQNESEDKIESINHDQSKIEVKIKNNEKLTVEKKIKIRKIADDAVVNVEKIMKEKDLSKVTDQYNSDLEDL